MEGLRHVLGVDLAQERVVRDARHDGGLDLLFVRVQHLLEGGELARIAGLDAPLLAGDAGDAVVQGKLQQDRAVDVAGGGVEILLGDGGREAAGDRVVAGGLNGSALLLELLDHRVVGAELELAAQDLVGGAGAHDEVVRRLVADADDDLVDGQADLRLRLEDEPAQLVRGGLAIGRRAAEGDAGHGGEAAEGLHVRGGDDHGHVVHLHERERDQLLRLLRRENAAVDVLAEVGIEVLVRSAEGDAERGRLDAQAQVDEPHCLQRLLEALRRIGGHAAAVDGDLFELRAARLVLFLLRHLVGELGVAVREADRAVEGDLRGGDIGDLLLIGGIGAGDLLVDLLLHGLEADADRLLIVDRRVREVRGLARDGHEDGAVLIHERHPVDAPDPLVLRRLAVPVREVLLHDLPLFLPNGRAAVPLALGEQVDLVQIPFPLQLRDQERAAVLAGGIADDQLAVVDADAHVLQNVCHALRAADDLRLALGLHEGLGEILRAVGADLRGTEYELPEPRDAVRAFVELHHVHVQYSFRLLSYLKIIPLCQPPTCTVRPRLSRIALISSTRASVRRAVPSIG